MLENKCTVRQQNPNLSVKLIGTRSNRDGIGSRLRFQYGTNILNRVLMGGGSYLSSHSTFLRETRLEGAVGTVIIWPSGSENPLNFKGEPPVKPIIVVESSGDVF